MKIIINNLWNSIRFQKEKGGVYLKYVIVASLLAASAIIGVQPAQAYDISLTFKGSTAWSAMADVVVRDSFAYCAMYSGLMILNVRDPARLI